jgi:DNA-binding response OmpR family regulator
MNPSSNFSVLVVDDSDVILHSLKNFFLEYHIDVVTAYNGLDGIQKAMKHKPSLIFLDLMMPNFDGIKMLQVIKIMDDLKKIPVIVISGNTNRSNVMAAMESGAERVISKPLQKDIILKNIKEVLGDDALFIIKSESTPARIDDQELVEEFKQFFIDSFPPKRDAIHTALASKNRALLKTVAHEIKGSGSTIGYPELTSISREIELCLSLNIIDWDAVKLKCDKIFSIIEEIQSLKTLSGN